MLADNVRKEQHVGIVEPSLRSCVPPAFAAVGIAVNPCMWWPGVALPGRQLCEAANLKNSGPQKTHTHTPMRCFIRARTNAGRRLPVYSLFFLAVARGAGSSAQWVSLQGMCMCTICSQVNCRASLVHAASRIAAYRRIFVLATVCCMRPTEDSFSCQDSLVEAAAWFSERHHSEDLHVCIVSFVRKT